MILMLILWVGGLAFLVGFLITSAFSDTDLEPWAQANGVVLGPVTAPVVEVYLRNRRGLRRVGALAGLIIPPAFTAATGLDLHVSGFVWVLLGYLVGQVIAELSLARVPASPTRAASLSPRRLLDYLPRPLAVAQVALPAIAAAVGIVVAVVAAGATRPPSFEPGAIDPLAGALVAAPVAVLLAAATLAGERRLVRRPQPIVEPDLVALDDAMRSSSVRTVAATVVAITAVLLTTQLGALAYHTDARLWQGICWLGAGLVLLFAVACWQRWVNRGWRVRRPDAPATTGVPA